MLDVAQSLTNLDREVARLSSRLAAFLAASFNDDAAVSHGIEFLESLGREPLANGRLARSPHANRLERLIDAYHFTPVDVSLLVLAGLSEEHEGFSAIFRSLHPRGEPYPSVGFAAQLLFGDSTERSAIRAALQTGPLARSAAVKLTGDGPFFEQALRPAEAIWMVLRGIDAWPTSLRPYGGTIVMHGLDEWLGTDAAARASIAVKLNSTCRVVLTAEREEVAFQRGLILVQEAGGEPAGVVWPVAGDRELERLLSLHAVVRGAVPVLLITPQEGSGQLSANDFQSFPGTVVLCGRTGAMTLRSERPVIAVPIEPLSTASRRESWSRVLPELQGEAAALAARFSLEPTVVAEVAADVRLLAELEHRTIDVADVASAVRARGAPTLAAGVKRVRPRAGFEQLVLTPDKLERLREVLGRASHQPRVIGDWGFLDDRPGSRGIRVLFAGPPGTGKTLAAEVLACELGTDLLVVDLSRMVSKWLGETEKNLAAAFDAAEQAHAALFFDEADALFGKRTEVSDAHDRYANLETAYLLARLERFDGLAVLATNFRQNIDTAFSRRLEFTIEFDEPGRDERLALWRCHIPHSVPVADDLDLRELSAGYAITGGLIRNAAVAAAFLAAADGTLIQRRHVIHALRREYEKAGKAFPGSSPPRSATSAR